MRFNIWKNSWRCAGFAEAVNMKNLKEIENRFQFHPQVLYAADVIFQQSNTPCGNIINAKMYLSDKHKLHGIK